MERGMTNRRNHVQIDIPDPRVPLQALFGRARHLAATEAESRHPDRVCVGLRMVTMEPQGGAHMLWPPSVRFTFDVTLMAINAGPAAMFNREERGSVDVDDVIGIWPQDEEAQDGTAD